MSRQPLVRAGLPVVLVLLLAACAAPPATAPTTTAAKPGATAAAPVAQPFRLAEQARCVCQMAAYVAMERGMFERQGLQVELVTEPTPLVAPLAGSAEASMAAPTQALLAASKGEDVKIVATLQSRLSQAVVLGPNEQAASGGWAEVLRGLKGKTVGVTVRGGSTDNNLRFMLKKAGVDPERDMSIVPLGLGNTVVAGMQTGSAVAVMSYQPVTATMVKQGVGRVAIDLAKGEGPAELNFPMTVAVMRGAVVNERQAAARGFNAAIGEAARFIADTNNDEAVKAVARKYLEGTDEAILPDLLVELRGMLDTGFMRQQLDNTNQILIDPGQLTTAVEYDKVIATDILNR